MGKQDFFRIERQKAEGQEHFVVHGVRPRFTLHVDPQYNPEGKPGRGFIKSLHIANGWGNDYLNCRNLLSAAEKYFREEFQKRKAREASHRLSPSDSED